MKTIFLTMLGAMAFAEAVPDAVRIELKDKGLAVVNIDRSIQAFAPQLELLRIKAVAAAADYREASDSLKKGQAQFETAQKELEAAKAAAEKKFCSGEKMDLEFKCLGVKK